MTTERTIAEIKRRVWAARCELIMAVCEAQSRINDLLVDLGAMNETCCPKLREEKLAEKEAMQKILNEVERVEKQAGKIQIEQ